MVVTSGQKAIAQFLDKFPSSASSYILSLVESSNFRIILTNQRKSRHGSFAVSHITRQPTIRISYHLSRHLFLLVFLHEVAHFKVWLQKGNRHRPHGKEWKNEFSLLLQPLLTLEQLDTGFKKAIHKVIQHPGATFNNNIQLLSLVNNLDSGAEFNTVRNIEKGMSFSLNGKNFVKMNTLRTRCKCYCPDDKKYYLVSLNAQIFQ